LKRRRYCSLICTVVLFLFLVFMLLAALAYPMKAKIFPLIIIPLSLGLLGIQILTDIVAIRQKNEIKNTGRVEADGFSSSRLLGAIVWIALSLLGFFLFGHMALFFLLPLAYCKLHQERWLSSIGLSFGYGIGFYIVFNYALEMRLYEGILFSLFLH